MSFHVNYVAVVQVLVSPEFNDSLRVQVECGSRIVATVQHDGLLVYHCDMIDAVVVDKVIVDACDDDSRLIEWGWVTLWLPLISSDSSSFSSCSLSSDSTNS